MNEKTIDVEHPKRNRLTIAALLAHNPCDEGREFLAKCGSIRAAWGKCTEPSWMFWALARVRPLTKQESVTLAVRFARKVLALYEGRYPNDKRPRAAIEAAENYLTGGKTAAAARASADAASSAASAHASAYAAASAAASAHASAHAAASAAADAAYAAYAAYAAASAAYAAADARQNEKIEQCNIIREVIEL